MTEGDFIGKGANQVLEAWPADAFAWLLPRVLAQLEGDGFVPGPLEIGPIAGAIPTFGRYVSTCVSDPQLGSFVLRLNLLVAWDGGAQLVLTAFGLSPSAAPGDVDRVVPGGMATATLAKTDIDWSRRPLEQALPVVRAWLTGVLAEQLDAALAEQWPGMRREIEQAMAP